MQCAMQRVRDATQAMIDKADAVVRQAHGREAQRASMVLPGAGAGTPAGTGGPDPAGAGASIGTRAGMSTARTPHGHTAWALRGLCCAHIMIVPRL